MKHQTQSIHPSHAVASLPPRGLMMTYSMAICCDIALYALDVHVVRSTRHRRFQCLCSHHVDALRTWLYSRQCDRRELRFNDSNQVMWFINDSEVVYWLSIALEFGVTETVLLNLAIDEANYENDMQMLDTRGDFDETLLNQALCDSYQALHHYYCRKLQHKAALIKQLKCLNAY